MGNEGGISSRDTFFYVILMSFVKACFFIKRSKITGVEVSSEKSFRRERVEERPKKGRGQATGVVQLQYTPSTPFWGMIPVELLL